MKNTIFCCILCMISLHLLAQVDVEIKVNGIRGGKPPLKFYNSDITIKNTLEKPCWIVFPNYIEDTIMNSGIFEAEATWQIGYLFGKGYKSKLKNGNPGTVTEIVFLGKYQQSFRAFLVPGKSTLFLQNYSFESDTEPDSMDVAVATSLMVNDSIALEKFLPYKIIADANLSVDAMNTDWDNLNMDRTTYGERKDLPSIAVRFIHAVGMKKYRKAMRVHN
jgi:hypothetical protein